MLIGIGNHISLLLSFNFVLTVLQVLRDEHDQEDVTFRARKGGRLLCYLKHYCYIYGVLCVILSVI